MSLEEMQTKLSELRMLVKKSSLLMKEINEFLTDVEDIEGLILEIE